MKQRKIYGILITLVIIVSYIKCFIGFPSWDEQFYSALTYRFVQGDQMIMNEWILAQLFSFILIPIVSFYHLLFKSNDGIILFMRLFYVTLQIATAYFVYINIKKKSPILLFACMFFILVTPFNIMALSYNTMSIMFFTIFLILSYINQEKSRNLAMLSGIFLSLTVLCVPMMTIFFILYGATVIYTYFKKGNQNTIDFFSLHHFLNMTGGILLTSFIFLIYVNPLSNINSFMVSLENILSDPSHSLTIMNSLIDFFYQFLKFGNVFFIINAILLVKIVRNNQQVKKERYFRFSIYCCLAYVIICTIMIASFSQHHLYSIFNMMISLLGISTYYTYKIKDKRLYCIYLISFSLPIALNLQSNVQTTPLLTGLVVTSLFSLLLINESSFEIFFYSNKAIINLCICVFIGFILYKLPNYLDTLPSKYIGFGSARGIFVSNISYNSYTNQFKDAKEIEKLEGDNLLALGCSPMIYLDSKKMSSSYASIFNTDDVEERDRFQSNYYKIHPDKYPNYVYICGNNEERFTNPIYDVVDEMELKQGVVLELNKIDIDFLDQD